MASGKRVFFVMLQFFFARKSIAQPKAAAVGAASRNKGEREQPRCTCREGALTEAAAVGSNSSAGDSRDSASSSSGVKLKVGERERRRRR